MENLKIYSNADCKMINFIHDVYLCVSYPFLLCLSHSGSDCSRNFTSPSGLIESPGFPDKYPHNLECSFIIVVPPSMDVTLTFLTFDLENDPLPGGDGDCKYDWLEVWDGLPGGEPFCCNPRMLTVFHSRVGGSECQAGSLTAPLVSTPSKVKHCVLRRPTSLSTEVE